MLSLFDLAFPFAGAADGGVPSVPPVDPITPITVATPLRCQVDLYPATSVPVDATGGGGIPTLLARTNSDHIVRITSIANDISGATVVPPSIRYSVADGTGVLVGATLTAVFATGEWRIALPRTLFTPTRGPMTLTITLVAPSDATETALQFTLAQGVRQ